MDKNISTYYNMKYNQYIGARYVPLIFGEWDSTKAYEPLTVVTYQGNSYTSKTYVPANIAIDNETYWVLTGNYNAQVEAYRQEVQDLKVSVNTLKMQVLNVTDYGVSNTGVESSAEMLSLISEYPNKAYFFPNGNYVFAAGLTMNTVLLDVNAVITMHTSEPLTIGSIIANDGYHFNLYNPNYQSYLIYNYQMTLDWFLPNGGSLPSDVDNAFAMFNKYINSGENRVLDLYMPNRYSFSKTIYFSPANYTKFHLHGDSTFKSRLVPIENFPNQIAFQLTGVAGKVGTIWLNIHDFALVRTSNPSYPLLGFQFGGKDTTFQSTENMWVHDMNCECDYGYEIINARMITFERCGHWGRNKTDGMGFRFIQVPNTDTSQYTFCGDCTIFNCQSQAGNALYLSSTANPDGGTGAVAGLHIDNLTMYSNTPISINCDATGGSIQDIYVYNCQLDGFGANAIFCNLGTKGSITDFIFTNNYIRGFTPLWILDNSKNENVQSVNGIVFTNNWIGNTGGSAKDNNFYFDTVTNVNVSNNSFYEFQGEQVVGFANSKNCNVVNNTGRNINNTYINYFVSLENCEQMTIGANNQNLVSSGYVNVKDETTTYCEFGQTWSTKPTVTGE